MKKLIIKLWNKALDFVKWVWSECKDWRTLLLLGVVCLVIGLPVWLGYLLAIIFRWKWAFALATIVWGFWMLPGAPFFALSVSVTLVIKRAFEKLTGKRRKQEEAPQEEIPSGESSQEESADPGQSDT